jgi:hypothetical protein
MVRGGVHRSDKIKMNWMLRPVLIKTIQNPNREPTATRQNFITVLRSALSALIPGSASTLYFYKK